MSPVYGAPWFTTEDIEKNAIKRLKEYRNNDVISETNYYNIYTFLERNILNNSPLFEKKYSEQVTLLNYSWWNEIFDDSSRYVFELDAEAIISFIIQNFLSSQSGPLFEILCNTNIQGLIEKKFNNIDCCFSLEKNSGTYLFWHLDEDGKRWSMWRDSDELKSEDKSFTIPMIPDVLGQNLKDKKIIPSGMLIYTILVGYFWITCFGWIFQSKYLEKIINAYCDLFPEESEISQGLDISTICADMYFIFSSQNLPMTALDMVINKNNIQYRQEQTVLESIKNSFADL